MKILLTCKLWMEIGKKYLNHSVNNNLAIRIAADRGFKDAVTVLLRNPHVDPSANDSETIRFSSQNGHLEIVKLLLEDGRVDPSVQNFYALNMACLRGHIEVVKVLIEHPKMKAAKFTDYALTRAAEKGYLEIVKLLLYKLHMSPYGLRDGPCFGAITKGKIEVAELLLQDSQVKDGVEEQATYLLQKAVTEDYPEVVKLLLKHVTIFQFGYSFQHPFSKNKKISRILLEDDRFALIGTNVVIKGQNYTEMESPQNSHHFIYNKKCIIQ